MSGPHKNPNNAQSPSSNEQTGSGPTPNHKTKRSDRVCAHDRIQQLQQEKVHRQQQIALFPPSNRAPPKIWRCGFARRLLHRAPPPQQSCGGPSARKIGIRNPSFSIQSSLSLSLSLSPSPSLSISLSLSPTKHNEQTESGPGQNPKIHPTPNIMNRQGLARNRFQKHTQHPQEPKCVWPTKESNL